jgi:hypothetical protein
MGNVVKVLQMMYLERLEQEAYIDLYRCHQSDSGVSVSRRVAVVRSEQQASFSEERSYV